MKKLLLILGIFCASTCTLSAEWVDGVWVRRKSENPKAWYNQPRFNRQYPTQQSLALLRPAAEEEYNRFYTSREELINKINMDKEIFRRIDAGRGSNARFSITAPNLHCKKRK